MKHSIPDASSQASVLVAARPPLPRSSFQTHDGLREEREGNEAAFNEVIPGETRLAETDGTSLSLCSVYGERSLRSPQLKQIQLAVFSVTGTRTDGRRDRGKKRCGGRCGNIV